MKKKVISDVESLGVVCDAELMSSWLDGVHAMPLTSKMLFDVQQVLRYYSEIIAPGKRAKVMYPTEGSGACAFVAEKKAHIPVEGLLKGEVDQTIFTVCHELAHLQHSPTPSELADYMRPLFVKVLSSIWANQNETVLDLLEQETVATRFFNPNLADNSVVLEHAEMDPISLYLKAIFGWTLFAFNCVEDARIDDLYPPGILKYKDKSIAKLKSTDCSNNLALMEKADPQGFHIFKDYMMYAGYMDRDEEWENSFGLSPLRQELDKNNPDNISCPWKIMDLMTDYYWNTIQSKFKSIWEKSSASRINGFPPDIGGFLCGDDSIGCSSDDSSDDSAECSSDDSSDDSAECSSDNEGLPKLFKEGDVVAELTDEYEDLEERGGDFFDSEESEASSEDGPLQDLSKMRTKFNSHELREAIMNGHASSNDAVLSKHLFSIIQGFEYLTIVECREIFGEKTQEYKCGIVDATDVLT